MTCTEAISRCIAIGGDEPYIVASVAPAFEVEAICRTAIASISVQMHDHL
jgi:hypothetical protein